MLFPLIIGASVVQARLHFALYGDDRDGYAVHREIVGRILAERPQLVINTGDLVRRGSEAKLWPVFDEITAPLRKAAPYYPVAGNHDYGTPDFNARFHLPVPSGERREYYEFNRGGCLFIGLDVDGITAYGPGSSQYEWLANELRATRSKFAHTFVFFHVPPYSIGSHGMNPKEQRVLCPLFEKYRVDAVLNGHDHIYYRTLRNGVTYIVSGGGGAPLYPVEPSKGAIEGDKYESTNNYVIFDVNGPKVHFRALRKNGSLIEEGELPGH